MHRLRLSGSQWINFVVDSVPESAQDARTWLRKQYGAEVEDHDDDSDQGWHVVIEFRDSRQATEFTLKYL